MFKTLIITLLFTGMLFSQQMDFEEYDPPSTLVVPEHVTTSAKFPFIDVHNHQFRMPEQDISELIVEMDKLNMAVMVNLSGRGFRRIEQPDGSFRFALQSTDYLNQAVTNANTSAPGRFIIFTNVDFSGIGEEGLSLIHISEPTRPY